MPYREFHYRWEYRLKSEPERLWSFVADTNRFNRDTGVPSISEGKPGSGCEMRGGDCDFHFWVCRLNGKSNLSNGFGRRDLALRGSTSRVRLRN